VEAVVEIFHDRRGDSFHLFRPEQREATAGGVTYDPLPETEDVFCYLNLHSHNRMPAFFSETDDEYETKTGLYGVIGRLGAAGKPEAVFRMSCGGNFVYLGAERLFDDASLVNSLVDQPYAVRAGGTG
jgi:PRTRC genetic system protein A